VNRGVSLPGALARKYPRAAVDWMTPPRDLRSLPHGCNGLALAGRLRNRYTSRMNADPLEQIQTKIAFLERAASELSDVVFRQHREIQALEARVKTLSDRLMSRQSDDGLQPPEQERPPHY
jgi:uncharacterized coiled-coil protein SlyX